MNGWSRLGLLCVITGLFFGAAASVSAVLAFPTPALHWLSKMSNGLTYEGSSAGDATATA
jgi:hypothetical protein